ncbi:hypothetical protein BC936DRAFT_140555 [Jimgerdemannia flammicorona]|uniref:Uncharacterized protein n=1 Tax=Jimgerdemannia flammicorona TaxID=994334 RepID=A0A433DGY1_9FUNG|nr:hypothetical protein BC936DRAFT_140555 [Jimgerdemannia flammicorona]
MLFALDDQTLLEDRGALVERAKSHLLNAGFVYKRGRSRSKLLPATQHASKEEIDAKRAAHALANSDARRSRMQVLQQMIQVGSTDTGKELGKELNNL